MSLLHICALLEDSHLLSVANPPIEVGTDCIRTEGKASANTHWVLATLLNVGHTLRGHGVNRQLPKWLLSDEAHLAGGNKLEEAQRGAAMRRKEEGIQTRENVECFMHEARPQPWRKTFIQKTSTGKHLTTCLLKCTLYKDGFLSQKQCSSKTQTWPLCRDTWFIWHEGILFKLIVCFSVRESS